MIEVWNKSDRFDDGLAADMAIKAEANQPHPATLVSALTGVGMEALEGAIGGALKTGEIRGNLILRPTDGAARSWLHEYADVLDEQSDPEMGNIMMRVSFTLAQLGSFQSLFPAIGLDTEIPD